MSETAITPSLNGTHRTIVANKAVHPGKWPGEVPEKNGLPVPAVEVEVIVRVVEHAENELIAHYLINQVTREVLKKVDRMGLDRIKIPARFLSE